MKAIIEILTKLLRVRSKSIRLTKPNRIIAIVGPDRVTTSQFVKCALSAETEGVRRLLSDMPVVGDCHSENEPTQTTDAVQSSERQFDVSFLTDRGVLRHWRFYCITDLSGDFAEENCWKRNTDTMLVTLPFDSFGNTSGLNDETRLRLLGTISACRNRGRLRRVAFLIMGIPEDVGLNHPTQYMLVPYSRQPLATSLTSMIRKAAKRVVGPFSDSRWRLFLTDSVIGDNGFMSLYETCRRTVKTTPPICFLPQRKCHADGTVPLLHWIDGHKQRKSGLVTNLANVMSYLSLFALSLVLALLMATLTLNEYSSAYASKAEVTELESSLKSSLESFSRIPVRVLITADTAELRMDELRLVLLRTQYRNRIEQLEDEISKSIAHLRAVPGVRDSICIALRSIIAENWTFQTQVLERLDTTALHSSISSSFEERLKWAGQITALLSLSTLDPSCETWLDSLSSVKGQLSSFDPSSCPPDINPICATKPIEYYVRLTGLSSDSTFLQAITPLQLSDLICTKSAICLLELLPRLSLGELAALDIRKLVDWLRTANVLSRSDLEKAKTLQTSINEALTKHDMVVRFTRAGDFDWHLDVKVEGTGEFIPTGCQGDRCDFRITKASPGLKMLIVCNSRSRIHLTSGEENAPCVSETGVNFSLTNQKGRIAFGDNRFEVEYEVSSGWPVWPPEGDSNEIAQR